VQIEISFDLHRHYPNIL